MLTVLWDNDGVLVDTEGVYFQACRETLATIGIPLSLEQYREISLQRGESTFSLATEQGAGESEVQRLRAQRDDLYATKLVDRSCVIDGVADVLRALHGRARMGVVTSARRRHFDAIHQDSGLIGYMDFVLTREDYQHSKPHPEPYQTALHRFELNPRRCLVVEDSQRGLASATAAGIDCVVVASSWTTGSDFTAACAVVDDISGVREVVAKRMGP